MKKLQRLFILMVLALSFAGCAKDTEIYLEEAQTESVPETEQAQEEVRTQKPDKETEVLPLVVYVCGEVVNPGVYELTSGMRICDAVDAAGGLTKKASRDYWNLAEELTDGQMLYFPTAEEAKKREESAAEPGGTADGKVNINTADISQLLTIPGIGQTRAEAVLAYRQENGSFQSIEDIMKVSGIKNGLFERMKDYITVG